MVHPAPFRASISLMALLLLLPATMALPEVRSPDEATVFVDGDEDFFEFSPGSVLSQGTTLVIVAPDGATATVTRTDVPADPFEAGAAQRWLLSGTQVGGMADLWSWSGDLSGAAADGTWTVLVKSSGVYYAYDDGNEYFDTPLFLAVQGRSVTFPYNHLLPATGVQTWNWHEGSLVDDLSADRPNDHPAEDPERARFFRDLPA